MRLVKLPKSFHAPQEGYRIRHVAEYIGCCTKTLKKAEEDGRIPEARRSSNNYRIYSVKEVEHIAEVLIGSHFKECLGKFPDILFQKRLTREAQEGGK